MGVVCERALKARLEITFGVAFCRAYLLAPYGALNDRSDSEDLSEYFLSLKPFAVFDWRYLRWLDLRPTAPKNVGI